jgi:hypothetical protein
MLHLRGGVRLRSRTLKTLAALGAVLALASTMVGSASAEFFPSPPSSGWYVGHSVTGNVVFHPADHQGIRNVTCKLSNGTPVGARFGDSLSDPTNVLVTVSGDSPSPAGTVVTCTGTLLQEREFCPFGLCIWTGIYDEAGPAVETVTLHIDASAPFAAPSPSTNPNANGWYNAPHSVNFIGGDPNSGIAYCVSGTPFGPGIAGQSIGPPDGGSKIIRGGCVNMAGILSLPTFLIYNYDATAPTLSPTVSPNPVLRGGSATASPHAGDNLSGVASSSCGAVDTSALGSFSVGCIATDKAGNSNSATASYEVVLGFDGFFQPVDMVNTNLAKAGQTIPLKFNVADANGPVTDLSSVSASVQGVSCDLGDTLDQIEEYSQAASGLQNLGGGAYQFNWATPKSYASSCKTLQLDVAGVDHTADFRFTK